MMNMTRALRLSASCLVLMTGAASAYSIQGDIPPLSLLKLNTHTQTQNSSADAILKNQSSLSSSDTAYFAAGIMLEQRASRHNPSTANRWLTASVCFITDTNDCSGNTFGDGEGYPNKPNPIDPIQPVPDEDKCSELGFKKTSCSEGYSPSGFCSYNSAYFKECVCSEACPNGYQDYPCGSGMLQADTVTPNCKTCYKCIACEDECPSGHTTESGSCRQASSYVTECGNKCYKVLDNSCKSGQLSAPAESGGYKNKIVSYTDCGNPCFQSYNDNCDSGYVKTKESGKCYETTAKYSDYGTACYKEKACCDDTCSGYKQNTAPTTTQCQWGYNQTTTGCGNKCYTCKSCSEAGYTVSCPPGQNHISGGSGDVCEGKYKKCTCEKGYAWDTASKTCKLYSGVMDGLYYCKGVAIGVQVLNRDFVIALNEPGNMTWSSADTYCAGYNTSCKGFMLPTTEELTVIHDNISYVQDKLSNNGGKQFGNKYYWSSSPKTYGNYTFVNPLDGSTGLNGGSQSRGARCVIHY